MLVDDAEADLFYHEYIIQKVDKDIKIFKSHDGQEAIDFIREKNKAYKDEEYIPPTVILLDINMPLMNGFEFLDEFEKFRKENKQYESQVIIMVTSSDQQNDLTRTKDYDCVKGYQIKPLTEEKISNLLRDLELAGD